MKPGKEFFGNLAVAVVMIPVHVAIGITECLQPNRAPVGRSLAHRLYRVVLDVIDGRPTPGKSRDAR